MKSQRAAYLQGVLLLLSAVAIGLLQDKPFFWDTIQLGSKHAHWFYEQQFSTILLPANIDSGHPPFFGLYLAAVWSVFGKSLAVSHWAMLPFVWGSVLLLHPAGKFFSPKWGWLFPLIALANPILLTQLFLISPDAVLLCGFLLLLYGIGYSRNWAKVAGALLLAAISTRGMMVVVALFLYELYVIHRRASNSRQPFTLVHLINAVLPYLPSGLFALAFLAYHYAETGWIGYHAGSEWAPSFERAGTSQTLRNIALLGWRFLDFGLVFVWFVMGVAAVRIWRKDRFVNREKTQAAMVLFGILALFLSLPFLLYAHLHQHRYLLPAMLGLQLLVFTVVTTSELQQTWKAGLVALMTLGPASGHLWIYPDTVAQGWDSSLAHLPYYHLKEKMIGYLDDNNIPLQEIGTAFPEIGPQYFKDLSGRKAGFAAKDLNTQRYILYSNVMNDFSDAERQQLQTEWRVVERYESRGIFVILYTK